MGREDTWLVDEVANALYRLGKWGYVRDITRTVKEFNFPQVTEVEIRRTLRGSPEVFREIRPGMYELMEY